MRPVNAVRARSTRPARSSGAGSTGSTPAPRRPAVLAGVRPAHAQTIKDMTATAKGPTQIDLSWKEFRFGPPILGYKIKDSPSGADGDWTTLVAHTGTGTPTYSHTGLSPRTTRYYRIAGLCWGTNNFGEIFSDVASATTPASPPNAPTGLMATANGQTRIDLSWTAPDNTGGSDLTGYKIEASPNRDTGWTTLVDDTGETVTTYSHTGLTAGTTRYYRVSAINAVGTSNPLDVAGDTIEVPLTNLTATQTGSGEVDLSWTAPVVEAGKTITDYLVQYENSSWVDQVEFRTGSTEEEFTVTGLRPGTTYTFYVSAVLSYGKYGKVSLSAQTTATTPRRPGRRASPPTDCEGGQRDVDLAVLGPCNRTGRHRLRRRDLPERERQVDERGGRHREHVPGLRRLEPRARNHVPLPGPSEELQKARAAGPTPQAPRRTRTKR